MNRAIAISVLALLPCLSLAGCSDPAADAPKAAVGSAKPVPSATGAKPATTATGAATGTAAATATATATAAATGAPAAPAGALKLTPGDSKVEFTGAKVTGKHDGVFEKFDGWIGLEGDKPEASKVFVEIDLASVKTDSPKLDEHLKAKDFFEIETYPKATFTSTEIKAGGADGATHTITGNLNLHGVEKSVSFPATIKVEKDKVTANAKFSINRKDFNINYPGKVDDLIKDDVLLKLTISAKRS
jgi:polyisoprenoid-binding protein YceI